MLSSGVLAGTLVGPLIGGVLPPIMGIRRIFWCAGGVIFLTFLGTTLLIKEAPGAVRAAQARPVGGWAAIPDKRPVVAMLVTGLLLMVATMSIEPIITVVVAGLVREAGRVTVVAGVAMAATALGSILAAPRLGRLADRVGHWRVIAGGLAACAVLLIPQAFVTQAWQLVALRFLMGLALGGLLPCIASVIRHSVPDGVAGHVLGWSTSAQYAGQVAGPLAGGFVGGHFGMRDVFLGTSALMAAGAAFNLWNHATSSPR
jgi:MFS family permease